MNPILAARTRTPLRPGVHRFKLHWIVPAEMRPGTNRQLEFIASAGAAPSPPEITVAEAVASPDQY